MLILLPPSESKTAAKGRSRPLDLARLSFSSLTQTRTEVLQALAATSRASNAASVLKVSPNLTEEIARNTRLITAPATRAGHLYTGVLYDALDLVSLDPAALRRARRWIIIQSALFGALRLGDRVPPYRLSMGVSLPGVGPLARAWRAPLNLEMASAAGRRLIVDCRSSTYAAAWSPDSTLAKRWVRIDVPGATHNAKHTRGLAARAIAELTTEPTTAHALRDALEPTFQTHLASAPTPTKPWSLQVTAR